MPPKLPPPDPDESFDVGLPRAMELPAPMVVALGGELSAESDRLSDAILDFRPGLLFVSARA